MIQRPNAVGLLLCQQALVDDQSRGVSLINIFGRLIVGDFPSAPQAFTVFARLTDGLGAGTLKLGVSRLDTLEVIYAREARVNFLNPLAAAGFLYRVGSCVFPAEGRYEVSLYADDELVTDCVLTVVQRE